MKHSVSPLRLGLNRILSRGSILFIKIFNAGNILILFQCNNGNELDCTKSPTTNSSKVSDGLAELSVN